MRVIEEEFETCIEIPMDAYIPASYVKNEMIKLELYKRISGVWNRDDYEDMLDELVDRFGEPPQPVLNLLTIALIKAKAHEAFITSITYKNDQIKIEMADGVRIKMELTGIIYSQVYEQYTDCNRRKSGFVVDLQRRSVRTLSKV